jgi:hypothetical protein
LQISKKLDLSKNTRMLNAVSMFTRIFRFFNSYFVCDVEKEFRIQNLEQENFGGELKRGHSSANLTPINSDS